MKPIRITKKMQLKDFRATVYFNAFFRNRLVIPIIAVLALMSLVEVLTKAATGFTNLDYLFFSSCLILVLLVFIFIMAEKTVRKFNKNNKDAMGTTRRIAVDNGGITTEGKDEDNNKRYDWGEVTKVIETKGYFFVFLNVRQTIIIPKEFVKDGEVTALSKGFQEHLSAKKFERRCK